MNLVGAGGKGESVWLAWFMVDVLQGMVELSRHLDRPDLSRSYQQDRDALIQRVERAGWMGSGICGRSLTMARRWFSANEEAKIDSLPNVPLG